MNNSKENNLNDNIENKVLKTFWEDFTLEEDVWIPFKRFKYLIKNDIPVHSYLKDRRMKEIERGIDGQ